MPIQQQIFLAADNIVIARDTFILLIKRKNQPFKGMWAFPGGFVEEDEELNEAASRELKEETGLKIDPEKMTLVKTIGTVGRDPRFRTVSVVYLTEVDDISAVQGSDDASEARWFELAQLPELGFDHADILRMSGLIN